MISQTQERSCVFGLADDKAYCPDQVDGCLSITVVAEDGGAICDGSEVIQCGYIQG